MRDPGYAVRSLWLGTPAHSDIYVSVIWLIGGTLLFYVLATRRYKSTVAR